MTLHGNYFYCYTRFLRNYLIKEGFTIDKILVSDKTLKPYWAFPISNNLVETLKSYTGKDVTWEV